MPQAAGSEWSRSMLGTASTAEQALQHPRLTGPCGDQHFAGHLAGRVPQLDRPLQRRDMTLTELSDKVGVAIVNLLATYGRLDRACVKGP
jgi:hypothetical protein